MAAAVASPLQLGRILTALAGISCFGMLSAPTSIVTGCNPVAAATALALVASACKASSQTKLQETATQVNFHTSAIVGPG